MKKINWHMQEVLAFQEGLAQAKSLGNVEVTPRFSIETVEGRPKLSGIYHLAVQYEVDPSKTRMVEHEEAIIIDEVELNEATAYFEYALPFHIDFPPEANTPIQFKVDQVNASLTADGHVEVAWEVLCQYDVQGIEKDLKTLATETNAVQTESRAEEVEPPAPSQKKVQQAEQSTEAVQPTAENQVDEQQETVPEKVASKTSEPDKQVAKEQNDDRIPAFFQHLKDGTSTKSFIR